MNEGVRTAFEALRRGEGFTPLLEAFDALVASDPQEGARTLSELGTLSGFPPQLLDLLETRLPAPAPTPGSDPMPDPNADPNAESALEPTVILARRPPAPTVKAAAAEDADGETQFVPPTVPRWREAPPPAPATDPGTAHAGAPQTATPAGATPCVPAATLEPVDAPTVVAPHVLSPPPAGETPPAGGQAQIPTQAKAAEPTHTGAPSSQPSGTGLSQASGVTDGSTGTSGSRTTKKPEYEPLVGEPAPGALLRNRFLLEKVLGRGGMGVVFKARDLSREAVDFSNIEQNYVAIKLLNDSFKQNPNSIKILGREFTNTQKLSHPNIINLYDFDKDDQGRYFIAMELLPGEPLNDRIARLRDTGGLPFDQAFHLIAQMGSALAAAHNYKPPIIHSDFKPGNVYVSAENHVKVFDFGIARAARPVLTDSAQETTHFDPGSLGALTPAYASLEMLLGDDPDARDDIYALAIVAYELLTGKRPFGRKITALQAREQHLVPARIKGLSARQWRGLRRGLAFERAKRSQHVEQFIDDLRPRRSPLPLLIVAGVAGVGGFGWFLGYEPWHRQQQESALAAEVAAVAPAQLESLLKRSATWAEPVRQRITTAVIARLAELALGADTGARDAALTAIEALPAATQAAVFHRIAETLSASLKVDPPALVLQRMALVARLPAADRAALLAGVGDPIRNALITEARAAFTPETRHYDYARAQELLTQADRLFPDSKVIFDEKSQLSGRYEKLLSSFDERLNTLREQDALLPGAGRESIPEILAILTQLDPGQFPKAYAYLANSYYSAAKASEMTDPDRAAALVEAGLALFPDSTELKNQQVRLADLARARTQAATLAALRARLDAALGALGSGTPTGQTLEDLKTLRSLSPGDPLLATAARQAQAAIRAGLPELLKARDWDGATALVAGNAEFASAPFVAAQTKAIAEARGAVQARIAKLNAAVQERLAAGDLPGAEAALKELAEAAPQTEEIARGQGELTRAYLTSARAARAAGQWDRARTLVDQGLARVSDPQRRLSFEEERVAIDRDEAAGRQQVAQAERERQDAERQASIASVTQQFNDFVSTMAASEADTVKARGYLDRLAGLAPKDPLLESGLTVIAARFATAAGQQGDAGRWEDAIALVRTGQRLLPGVAPLDQELARLTTRYQEVQTQRNQAAIAAQETAVGDLIGAADFSPDWAARLSKGLAELSRLAGGDPARLAPLEGRLNARYEQRLAALLKDTQFAEARTLLEQWAGLAPNAVAPQKGARAQLDTAFAAWEKAEGERKRLAEIDANKQSLLTQAKADQPEKALATLEVLRGRLGADDPFVTGEAPRVIAQAEIRLAAQSAKRGRNDTALKLLDKAIELDPQAEVGALRAQIERNLAHDRLSAQIGSADAGRLADLETTLTGLKQQYPQDYPPWEDEWAKTLAARVKAEKTPAAGERLLAAARTLFPNAAVLKGDLVVQTPPPATPPPTSTDLDDARAALAARQLSAAERALTAARAQAPGNPGLAQVAQDLTSAKTEAVKAYKLYEVALAQGQVAKAEKALAIARQRWSDNDEWQQTGGTAVRPATPAAGPGSCNPKYAGYGNTRTARCTDSLAGDQKGPELVVIPQGPASTRPYAITRYEISVGDYNQYCLGTRECAPVAAKSGRLPVTGISIAQAQAYAAWLTRSTGAGYRLPSTAEWEQAARAKGEVPGGAVNCLLRSGGATIKGGVPDLVSTGANNSWGLVNTVGNVQEWTIDGGAIRAHGGHYADDAARCSISLSNAHSGQPDAYTGFRLVRDIRE